jgi:transposase, IS5 family
MEKKARTYRRNARKDYLALVKQRRPGNKKYRKAVGQQLRYLNRNLGHVEAMLDMLPGQEIPLPRKQLRQYWIIGQLYLQQKQMFDSATRRCDDRIVSIHQPHVRPIIRGKQNKAVEFGAKLGVSLSGEGIACVDHLSWDAYHEGHDLPGQVEAYRKRHGHYPEKLLADPLYGARENRKFLNEKGIRFAGKPLGRPPKMSSAENTINRRQRQQDYRERIPIEGKFGQGKNGYDLNYIRASTSKTSEAWIRGIFLVMNLLVLFRLLFARVLTHIDRYVTAVLEAQLHWLHTITARQTDKLKQSPLLDRAF